MSWGKITAVIISRLSPNSRRGLKERLRLDHAAAVTLYDQGSYDQARAKNRRKLHPSRKTRGDEFLIELITST